MNMSRQELLQEIRLVKERMLNGQMTQLEAARLTTALVALYESVIALDMRDAA
jgi:hypothetical protein